ncbi:MAG: glutathione synthase [Clostridia bacterium]|nr:glutathione synthase [Clostridia bacterium]
MTSDIFKGKFGLERETLRVDKNGKLAQTPHPFKDDNLSRDFCENQLEIITPVCNSIDNAVKSLSELSQNAETELNKNGEYLWLNSNPPHIENEDEIPVAKFDGNESSKHTYRCYLEQKYGKRIMLYSGIHFNLSFYNAEKNKNDFYMHLLKQTTKYSWLIVLFTAASPVYDKSFENDGQSGTAFDGKSSMRNSTKGYWNNFVPILDYSSLDSYCESIKNYIEKGVIISASELYVPVRIKPCGQNDIESLQKNGADHIELRMFDINPLSSVGVFTEDLKFAYLFLVYLSTLADFEFTSDLQKKAFENHKKAAEFDLSETEIDGKNIIDSAKDIINDMKQYFAENYSSDEISEILDFQLDKLVGKNRYSDKVYELYKNDFQNTMTSKVTKER